MEDSATAFPDWAHLPLAAVHLISQKVKCITDYVRFRAVCSPWRSASLPKPRHLPPQLPWLMIPYREHRGKVNDGICLFYDLWENKMRKIPLPEIIGKCCAATYRGWLLLVNFLGSEVFFLNPLTRDRVPLPPFHALGEDDKQRCLTLGLLLASMFKTHAINKISFSTDLTDPNCVIMVLFQGACGIFYCQVGDLYWTQVDQPPYPNAELADAAYNNGSFYLYYKRAMTIYNLNQRKVQGIYFFEPALKSLSKFFLVGKSGVYMAVVHPDEDRGGEDEEAYKAFWKVPRQKINLYQVIVEELRVDVKRVTDTNNTAIFYGDNYQYLAVSTDDWDRIVGGSIYMEYVYSSRKYLENEFILNRSDDSNWEHHKHYYGIFLAKMDNGNPEPVVLGINAEMPQISSPPPAMWFQPRIV